MGDDLADPPGEVTMSSIPDCPLCGQPVTTVTVLGPVTAVAVPCGCRAPPEVLLVDPDAARDAIGGRSTKADTNKNTDTNADTDTNAEHNPAGPDD
ncbi:uncharacterized protein Nmag_1539 [Natrialba magadii ATCC 43099]|uniref:Small CPxCG-related zinc finger protein n=1 Tax=Natrialba magadii (strain ATCC 43099 / DSM 3394 / CCM 3739 / CIP 104546 / IAM 13178 / JCM 8861 / NBRC 102185 / NCIMB 2190 / MS3) TaxID=547559 RepID=D3STU8_NATMM|nr:hypothetical protein [Natrialba magadii]ADD05115.1 uncharacterized protein Nmag_1539 [Natrialba magadii ATCC 43099]ELY23350.1 hypothetical protein C500_20221 [Natrialba magadii ATCC 43099]